MNFAMMLALAATVSAAPVKPSKAEAAGKSVFTANCTACHGQDAKGVPAMAAAFGVDVKLMNLTEALKGKSEADVVKIVTHGLNGKMPSFKGNLKPEQIKDVVAYVRSLAPKAKAGEKKSGDKKADEKKADAKPAGKN